MPGLLRREQIEERYTWRLEDIFPTINAWEESYHAAERLLEQFGHYQGSVKDIPSEVIRAYFALSEDILYVYSYAFLFRETDNTAPTAQAMSERAERLYVQFQASSAFLKPELLSLSDEALSVLQEAPDMSDYSEFLRTLRLEKQHTLSESEEALLAGMGEVCSAPERTFSMLTRADMHFPDIQLPDGELSPLTEGTYSTFIHHENQEVRRQAFHHLFSEYHALGNTFATIYGASVKKDVALATARHYASARQAAMLPLEIPETVYDNLISVIHESLPVLHRYLQLRKSVMGLSELHMYDLYVPMIEDFDMHLPFDTAFQLVFEGLKPLGSDYLSLLQTAKDNRWMDVYPAIGKSSGAFSSGELARVHPYVLLNHNDNLESAFTIAHELGHSMHSYYSNHTQPFPKQDYSTFVAEVASICNEAIMMRYLLEQYTDQKTTLFLLNHFLEQFRTTCFRQTMLAEFEMQVHEMAQRGVPLTCEKLSETYKSLNDLYYGPVCFVDPLIGDEWMRIPHFYSAFYVYVYATGLCAAVSLSDKILGEGDRAVADYKRFLSAGSSVPPLEALKLAGIDMEDPEVLRSAIHVFSDILDRFENAVKEG
ncbi:MAG: oligoendopeptidase F [Clostridia bacterium]|nr:oligoendopeptidase F [Clostridia bacterium]